MIAPSCSEFASEFLTALAGPSETFDWRVIHKSGLVSKPKGTFEQVSPLLKKANDMGAGIFVMVNATDGSGQTAANVITVRAVFVDLDGAPLEPVKLAALKPHLIVESSPNKWHAYWFVDSQFPKELFTPVQKAIAKMFSGDLHVCDLPRIMRLPGFYHHKGEPFLSRIVEKNEAPAYSAEQI